MWFVQTRIVKDFAYLWKRILMPQLQNKPGFKKKGFLGKCIVGTTPVEDPNHYSNEMAATKEIEDGGANYFHAEIYDRDDIKEEEVKSIEKACGGADSLEFILEYRAKRIVDPTVTVVAEYHDLKKEIIVENYERPRFYDAYTIGDLGFQRDLTFILFGFYHFDKACLIIEDEICEPNIKTKDLADLIAKKERALAYSKYLYKRKLETPERTIQDINEYDSYKLALPKFHGENVGLFSQIKTPTGSVQARLNQLKTWIKEGRIKIKSNCTNLQSHLKNGVWNKNKTDLKRVKGYGHFDGIPALYYLVDEIDQLHNPSPAFYGLSKEDYRYPSEKSMKDPLLSELNMSESESFRHSSFMDSLDHSYSQTLDELDF